MKSITIHPAKKGLQGTITMPGDKSISHRALIFASIAEGESKIKNLLLGGDVLGTMRILQQLGVKMSHRPEELKSGDELKVYGEGLHSLKRPDQILDCGNSGTTLRLLMGLLSAQEFESTLTGDASLNKRPIDRVIKPLEAMGASFQVTYDRRGRRLIRVGRQTPIKGGLVHKLVVASAQVKSAIMLAALYAKDLTTIIESAPTRDHTERMLASLGVSIDKEDNTIRLHPPQKLKGQCPKSLDLTIPGDFSSAAFFMVGGLIVPNSKVFLPGIGMNPTRTALLGVLQEMGGKITIENRKTMGGELLADLTYEDSTLKAKDLSGAIIPNMIDEIPIFAIAAACAKGTSRVSNAKELRVKESDRIRTLVTELTKLGVDIREKEDGFELTGGGAFKSGTFDSHGDHRIAMSLGIGSLLAHSPSVINNVDCVATSFPSFFDLLESLNR